MNFHNVEMEDVPRIERPPARRISIYITHAENQYYHKAN